MKPANKPTPMIVREPQQTLLLGQSSSSSDIESIWKAAVERYEELTGTDAGPGTHSYNAEKRSPSTTLTELEDEMSRAKSAFVSFRHPTGSNLGIDRIRRNLNATLGPIKALGGIVTHATKAVSESIFTRSSKEKQNFQLFIFLLFFT
jgi:hypothetical protein